MELALRIICCAVAGIACGYFVRAWARQLAAQRGLHYTLSPQSEHLLCTAMALPGGAVGALTSGIAAPLIALVLLCICGTVSLMDWLWRIIPNQTVLAVMGLKLLLGAAALVKLPGIPAFGTVQSLIGLFACLAVFFLPALLGHSVGAGDVKLAAAMGFLLGIHNALLGVVIMGLLVIGYMFVQRRMPLLTFLKSDIPMGPFIAAGMFTAFLGSAQIPALL